MYKRQVEPRTVVAALVQAADAISAARPGARRENVENYIKRLEKLEEITSSYPGVEKSYAIQAGREVRVMVKPEQVSEDQMVILARELAHRCLLYTSRLLGNLLHGEGFHNVAFLDVVELLDGQAALVAGQNLLGLILEALQGGQHTLVDDDAVPDQPDLTVLALELTVLHVAACHGTHAGDLVGCLLYTSRCV